MSGVGNKTGISTVWKYFEKTGKDCAKCKLCFKAIKSSGNTSNMSKHLRIKHSSVDVVQMKPLVATSNDTNDSSSSESQPQTAKRIKQTIITTQCTLLTPLEQQEQTQSRIQLISDKDLREAGSSSAKGVNVSYSGNSKPKQVVTDPLQPETPPIKTQSNPILRSFQQRASLKEGGTRHAAITNAILYHICVDYKSFHTVMSKGFLKLIKTLEPNYRVPSDTHLKKLMSNKYTAMKNALKETLQHQDVFCATCDIWTDTLNMTSFLGVTLHYIENTILKSANIATLQLNERHTGEYISQKLSEIFEDWAINKNKIIAILTDNGANMVSAIKNLFDDGSINNDTMKHIPCFAHTVNLLVEKVLSDGETQAFLAKIRDIVKYFKRSVIATDNLKKAQCLNNATCVPKKLILDVSTRWNSCFYMAERFVELASVISPILLKESHAPTMLSAAEMSNLRELISLLKPLEYITRELSGEQYVTISKVIPLINCLVNQVTNLKVKSALCVKAKEVLMVQILQRFQWVERNPHIGISTLLDPRFKNMHFRNPESCANALSVLRRKILAEQTSYMQTQMQSSGSDTDSVSSLNDNEFWKAHKELAQKNRDKTGKQDEITHYMKLPVIPLKSNPLESWEDMKEIFPSLYKQFRRHAVVVATSVPSERLFSKAGAVMTQDRNRLKPKILNELLFLAGRPENEWF